MAEEWRLFVALEIPVEARRIIARLQRDIFDDSIKPALKIVEPELVHITVKFLGDIDVTKASKVESILSDCLKGFSPFDLTASGVGCFPNAAKPRVVFAGLEGQIKTLLSLQSAVESGFQNAGFAPEEKPFTPHLTLARVRRDVKLDQLKRIGTQMEALRIGQLFAWDALGLTLMRSQLRPDGPIYTRLSEIPFTPQTQ